MHNSEPEFFKNLTCVAHQKCWVSLRGHKKDLAEGPQSLNTALIVNNNIENTVILPFSKVEIQATKNTRQL